MLPHVCSAGARCLWRAAPRRAVTGCLRPTSLQWHAKVMPTFAGRGIRLGIDLSILSCMVRHMPNQQMQLDRVFRALGDPTRRAVLGRLSAGPAPVSELARPFNIALPSFTQHLDVLERCGLVRSRKVGRVRTYRLVPQPLRAAERWITQQRAVWERRLDQLDDYLLKLKEDMR
jgi:DNA-binding transcriptional ArsR family regulator